VGDCAGLARGHLVDRVQVIQDLEQPGEEIQVCLVPGLCPLEMSPYDSPASRHLMQRRAEMARKWLTGGGLTRRF